METDGRRYVEPDIFDAIVDAAVPSRRQQQAFASACARFLPPAAPGDLPTLAGKLEGTVARLSFGAVFLPCVTQEKKRSS